MSGSAVETQTLWARTIVRALADAGVRGFVVSPGSRSTPLTAALASAPDLDIIVDERAAGFFALGRARALGAPVALVCTSGTAPAHYYPAVIEASMADVPLVVVSADRPPELQDGGAPQTIDQIRLFGSFARHFVDLGPPGDALAAVHRRVSQAVLASLSPRPGPVQINVPLRKPLEPVVVDDARIPRGTLAFAPATLASDDAIRAFAAAIGRARRPWIVAGARPVTDALAPVLSAFARKIGAAVLAETTSQLRGAVDAEVTRLDHFDLALAADAAPPPDLIVQLGAEPVAAAWPTWLARHANIPRWILAEHAWPDPHASAAGLVLGDVADAIARATDHLPQHGDREWLRATAAVDHRAREIVDELVRSPDSEGAAIRAALDGAGDALVVLGNSLPVRVADHVSSERRRVISQRGASGIDGLVAGAAGAASTGTPVVLILGDVSLAHDLGSLALLRRAKAPVTVVAIDNRGGRIFEALPVGAATTPDDLTRLWLTPQDLDVVAIARGFGLEARTVRSPDELRAQVAAHATTLLHVPVAPSSARDLRATAIRRLQGASV
jgi:2-succinyl-5-enolpyruvyl-6-hydroxy-3-cyclohexene-1-carboxylate synthase